MSQDEIKELVKLQCTFNGCSEKSIKVCNELDPLDHCMKSHRRLAQELIKAGYIKPLPTESQPSLNLEKEIIKIETQSSFYEVKKSQGVGFDIEKLSVKDVAWTNLKAGSKYHVSELCIYNGRLVLESANGKPTYVTSEVVNIAELVDFIQRVPPESLLSRPVKTDMKQISSINQDQIITDVCKKHKTKWSSVVEGTLSDSSLEQFMLELCDSFSQAQLQSDLAHEAVDLRKQAREIITFYESILDNHEINGVVDPYKNLHERNLLKAKYQEG